MPKFDFFHPFISAEKGGIKKRNIKSGAACGGNNDAMTDKNKRHSNQYQ